MPFVLFFFHQQRPVLPVVKRRAFPKREIKIIKTASGDGLVLTNHQPRLKYVRLLLSQSVALRERVCPQRIYGDCQQHIVVRRLQDLLRMYSEDMKK